VAHKFQQGRKYTSPETRRWAVGLERSDSSRRLLISGQNVHRSDLSLLCRSWANNLGKYLVARALESRHRRGQLVHEISRQAKQLQSAKKAAAKQAAEIRSKKDG